jgi:transposase
MTVFMTDKKIECASEVVGPERRRRWSLQYKLRRVRESYEPGMSVFMVARRHVVNLNQLFQ